MIDGSHSPYHMQEHRLSARWSAGTSTSATTSGDTAWRTSRCIIGGGAFWDTAGGPREPNGSGLTYWGAIAAGGLGHRRWGQRRVPSPKRHRGREDVSGCGWGGVLRGHSSSSLLQALSSAGAPWHHHRQQVQDQGSPASRAGGVQSPRRDLL
jgi:hypothetical protein